MTAQIAVHGRLVADVQVKTTSNDNQMAITRLAVSVPCRTAESGESTLWLEMLAFGKQSDALAKHRKGDMVSVSGVLQVNQWAAQGGDIKQRWQVIADSVISARTARPGGKKGQQGQATDALRRARAQSELNQDNHPYNFDQTPD